MGSSGAGREAGVARANSSRAPVRPRDDAVEQRDLRLRGRKDRRGHDARLRRHADDHAGDRARCRAQRLRAPPLPHDPEAPLLADERDIFELAERMDYAGRPVVPLDETGLRAIARTLKARGYEAVAVAFLFSHKNAAHERLARDILEDEMPGVYVSLSSEVAPVLGRIRAQRHRAVQRLCRPGHRGLPRQARDARSARPASRASR